MNIKILGKFPEDVLFEGEYESIKAAVMDALSKGANLSGADLHGANLSGANLRYTNLHGANLRGADLRGADLSGADLRGADLRGADLYGADLRGADLRGADLSGADLSGADLYGADLRGADLRGANLYDVKNAELVVARMVILPEGDLIVWKKCKDDVIVKLRVPADAKRLSASGRKCRAEYVEVLEVIGAELAYSTNDAKESLVYRVGDIVRCVKPFCEDRWQECASGIHFYITRIEAENH